MKIITDAIIKCLEKDQCSAYEDLHKNFFPNLVRVNFMDCEDFQRISKKINTLTINVDGYPYNKSFSVYFLIN